MARIQLEDELNSGYKLFKERNTSNIHLKSPLAGIVITDAEFQMPLDTELFDLPMFGGFTFDAANHRIYWDQSGDYGVSLPCTFMGAAGISVTAGISGPVSLTMMLKVDGETMLETKLTYTSVDKVQQYAANSVMVDEDKVNLLQSGSYYEIWAKAGAGESLTVELNTLNVTIKRD